MRPFCAVLSDTETIYSDFPLASQVFEQLETGCQAELGRNALKEKAVAFSQLALHMHYAHVRRGFSFFRLLFKTAATPLAMIGAALYQQASHRLTVCK